MTEPTKLFALDNPLDGVARIVEGLLVVASKPLSAEEIADAADEPLERVEAAIRLAGSRLREGRSGIVLEEVAGGYALRAAREAAEACGRGSNGDQVAGTYRRSSAGARSDCF